MLIVIAPDKFKGTLSALEVAQAIADGVRRALSDAEILLCPLADGGEGTIDALVAASRATERAASPQNGPSLACLPGGLAIVEMAVTARNRRSALTASTHETGVLLERALRTSPSSITVGVGGTVSTDGGTGAASALGWRFLDPSGSDLPLGGGPLVRLATIVPPPVPFRARVIAACDVDVPLTGPSGSARMFAPQKGASPEEVAQLEEGLGRLAERLRMDLGIDVSGLPFAGAGGGAGAGLKAFFGAELRSGFEVVAEHLDLRQSLLRADLVITGEGALDEQSLQGKAPVSVARWSREAGVRCIAIAGSISLTRTQLLSAGFDEWRALCGDSPGAEMAGGEDIAEAVKALVNKGSGRR